MVVWQAGRTKQLLDLGYKDSHFLSSLLKAALLGESLSAHQSRKLLERQDGFVQSLDGNLLEKLLTVPNDEDLLVGIDAQIHILADPVQVYVVASLGDAHGPILANFAHEMVSVNGY